MDNELDKTEELKKNKWDAFIKKYEARIKQIPQVSGKRNIPAVWDKNIQDWVWLSRGTRRYIERRTGK